MKITITANDGTEFSTKEECMTYEDEIAKKEEVKRAEKEHLLASKIKLQNDIRATLTELNEKASEYRKFPPCSIRYGLDDASKLCVEFDNPCRAFASGNGNPLIDLLMRM